MSFIAAYSASALVLVYLLVGVLSPRLFRPLPAIIGLGSAILLLAASLAQRSLRIGFIALVSTYDSLLFYAALVMLLLLAYLAQRRRKKTAAVGFLAQIVAFALLLVASSPLVGKEALPPVPALRSAWLVLHVAFSFIGEAFFVFGFVASLLFLARSRKLASDALVSLDRTSYAAILIGYSFFTLGALIFGAIWAEAAWGRFWSWDPKETWALVTWIIYSLYLHLRLYRKIPKTALAWVSVLGFLSTVFTFFGVNYLLSGLHSYR